HRSAGHPPGAAGPRGPAGPGARSRRLRAPRRAGPAHGPPRPGPAPVRRTPGRPSITFRCGSVVASGAGRSVAVLPVRSRGRAGPPVVRSRPAAGRPPVVRSVLVVRPAGAVRAAAGSWTAAGPGPQPVRRYAGAGGSDFDESPPSVADNHLSYEYCQPSAVSLRKSTRILLTRRTRSSASCFIATP